MKYYKTHRFQSFDGTRLYVRESGSGPLLLLIHGTLTDADYFVFCAEQLSQWFHVVAYDRRAHARSGQPKKNDVDVLTAHAMDAAALIDAFGRPEDEGKAYIVGHSLGGFVAERFAELYPEKVRKMLLHEPAFHSTRLLQQPKGEKKLLLRHDPESESKITLMEWLNLIPDGYALLRYDIGFTLTYAPPIEALKKIDVTVGAGKGSKGYAIYNESLHLAKDLGQEPLFLTGSHNSGFHRPGAFSKEVKELFLG